MKMKLLLVALTVLVGSADCAVLKNNNDQMIKDAKEASLKFETSLDELKGVHTFTKYQGFINNALPFIKAIGPLFSLIGKLVEKNQVLDEMRKDFEELNGRLDAIEVKLDHLDDNTNKIMAEIKRLEIDFDVNKVVAIQEAKKRFDNRMDSTTLTDLRRACTLLRPMDIIGALTNMVTSPSNDFLTVTFDSVQYNQKLWLQWTEEIGTTFLQAMVVEQVCLGVQINDDKTSPSQKDLEYYANICAANFSQVMQKLEERADYIDKNWFNNRLRKDVTDLLTSNYGQNEQELAEGIYGTLKDKYPGYFGVTVHVNDVRVHQILFNSQNAMVVPYNRRVAVINWSANPFNVSEHAFEVASSYNCENDFSFGDKYFNYLVDQNKMYFNSSNFNMVYLLVPDCGETSGNPQCRDKYIGSRSDLENTRVINHEGCFYTLDSRETECYDTHCIPMTITKTQSYALYTVLGY